LRFFSIAFWMPVPVEAFVIDEAVVLGAITARFRWTDIRS
jgi:hypothetical protein